MNFPLHLYNFNPHYQNDTNFREFDFKDMGHFWANQNPNLNIQNTAIEKDNLTLPTFRDLWGYEVKWRNPVVNTLPYILRLKSLCPQALYVVKQP